MAETAIPLESCSISDSDGHGKNASAATDHDAPKQEEVCVAKWRTVGGAVVGWLKKWPKNAGTRYLQVLRAIFELIYSPLKIAGLCGFCYFIYYYNMYHANILTSAIANVAAGLFPLVLAYIYMEAKQPELYSGSFAIKNDVKPGRCLLYRLVLSDTKKIKLEQSGPVNNKKPIRVYDPRSEHSYVAETRELLEFYATGPKESFIKLEIQVGEDAFRINVWEKFGSMDSAIYSITNSAVLRNGIEYFTFPEDTFPASVVAPEAVPTVIAAATPSTSVSETAILPVGDGSSPWSRHDSRHTGPPYNELENDDKSRRLDSATK